MVIGATATRTAAPGFDSQNNTVRYDAANLVDSADDTAWRADGDATGVTITLTLAELSQIETVGLLPGYAKIDPFDGTDRWSQNRRPVEIEWRFDDGKALRQRLVDAPTLQTIEVHATSRTIQLTILSVTEPSERDFTAISEVVVQ